MSNNKMKVEARGSELVISRILDAPPERVFQIWSSCEHLKSWWGPKEWPMDECTMDFREGGEWRYCLRGPNEGDESWGLAIYQVIVNPEKIVYRDHFTDSEGIVNQEMPELLVTVEFIKQSSQTRMVNTTLFDSTETRKSLMDMGAVEGWSSSLDRLEAYLSQLIAES